MISEAAKIMHGNRIVIPASIRKELGLQIGDALTLILENGQLRLISHDQAVKKAQKLLRQYLPPDTPLVDELITDRRQEAGDD
ncbi:MAG: AbrB/MazE/SpoVT family DNA-binding domain-containing protein [Chloroflexota bacterium]